MTRPLPERPDFGQLKKQAKDLLNAVRLGDPAALERSAWNDSTRAHFALHDAQRLIAREYGFPSWAKLKLHLETRTAGETESRLIEAALDGDADTVAALLAAHPCATAKSLAVAAALGDHAMISRTLGRDPAQANAATGPRRWPPLLYLCFGRCGGGDRDRALSARRLVELGADPNAAWIHETWPEAPLPALYGATGVNNYPELARVLLRAGANPNDGESRYHSAQHNHVASLEVLAEFGADFSGADKTWGNTPLCFLLGSVQPSPALRAGVHWLVNHGADPNVRSYADSLNETALHVAIRNDWDLATLSFLLDHGADPNATRGDGRTAYALALIFGRDRCARLLADRGATTSVSPRDAFLGACLRADAKTVRALLRRSPEIIGTAASADPQIIEAAARENRAAALELMHEAGIDVTKPIHEGATPLHWAAWYGRVEATRALLQAGADKNACDDRFKAPPIGWCAHGSQFAGTPDGDYAGVAEALITAGAFVPPGTVGSADVTRVLRAHGFKAGAPD